ncbi:hypothetical protein M432DRAFT_181091 [Thermoascus aurantiacus ATCC 26904]
MEESQQQVGRSCGCPMSTSSMNLVRKWTSHSLMRKGSVGGSALPSAPPSASSSVPPSPSHGGSIASALPETPTHRQVSSLQRPSSSPQEPPSSSQESSPTKTAQSQKARDLCLQRDQRQCVVTGIGGPINVAHIYPYSIMVLHQKTLSGRF